MVKPPKAALKLQSENVTNRLRESSVADLIPLPLFFSIPITYSFP